ncbi:zinc finger and BTB domain-containing protein 41-like isoform X2 [Daktulosphaira vitifoliae]|uniref:zinc finger and BTB domain-containing protein 41-like isoform X2 n=1 Tax=Daktulosphaira vitifoliae TaxID=58002 RepID=UPI0021AA3DBF|nr:zinc finger and BTB domain-containing protein 41-like isoform X2 [Daktulosphaira vitifoliae]XP_050536202.1 zinc finger and BTB domain-containing protein 41-like isoform X2 [Daktulosphaira vitifoliae]
MLLLVIAYEMFLCKYISTWDLLNVHILDAMWLRGRVIIDAADDSTSGQTRGGGKRWECPRNCGRSYKNKKHLQRHMCECGVPPQFKCDKCEKTFKRKDHMKKHVKCCAEGSNTFTCAICLRKFGYKSNWRNHMIFKHSLTEEWLVGAGNYLETNLITGPPFTGDL